MNTRLLNTRLLNTRRFYEEFGVLPPQSRIPEEVMDEFLEKQGGIFATMICNMIIDEIAKKMLEYAHFGNLKCISKTLEDICKGIRDAVEPSLKAIERPVKKTMYRRCREGYQNIAHYTCEVLDSAQSYLESKELREEKCQKIWHYLRQAGPELVRTTLASIHNLFDLFEQDVFE